MKSPTSRRFSIAGFVLLASFCMACTAGDEKTDWRAKVDALAAKRATRQDWGKVTSEFLNIANAEGPSDDDKSYALLCCMKMLDAVKKAKPADRGIQIFAEYKKGYWGRNKPQDEEAAKLLVAMNLRRLTEYPNKLNESLAVIDSLEKLNREDLPEFNAEGRQLKRAQAYVAAKEPEEAVKIMAEYFGNQGDRAQPMAYNIAASAYAATGDLDKALDFSARGVEKYGDSASDLQADPVIRRLRILLEKEPVTPENLAPLLPRMTSSRLGMHAVASVIATMKTSRKEYETALGYGKLAFNLAPASKASDAAKVVSNCLNEVDPTIAAEFDALQKAGAAGPDEVSGTADDLPNPLAKIQSALPPEVIAKAEAELAARIQTDDIYQSLKRKGTLCMVLGRTDDALEIYRRAYAAASWEESADAASLIGTGLNAKFGTVKAGAGARDYGEFGPAGKDGIAGTEDDIVDPLKGVKARALPGELEAHLRAIAGDATRSADSRQAAMRALGDAQGALNEALAARAKASDERTVHQTAGNVAAAMRALDGHCAKARKYLRQQQAPPAAPEPPEALANQEPL